MTEDRQPLVDLPTPDFIVYEVTDRLFVVGDENRVDIQFFADCDPRSILLYPVKLFTLNNRMVRVDCPDKARQIYVSAAVRRDGLELPDVFDLDTQPSVAIRAVRDWCEEIILAAAGAESKGNDFE